jgi:very-short-patch-repair endonuclease
VNNDYYNKKLKGFARSQRKHGTKAEILLWCKLLRNKRMMGYSFLRQRPIGHYIADFFCKKLKLVIETDGITHEYVDVFKRDIEKTNYLNSLGYEVLRFKDDEVIDDIDSVKYIIESWIANHPPTPFEGGILCI